MSFPSVTGRKPHVPERPEAETTALAYCRIPVSLLARHSNMLVVLADIDEPLKQPVMVAKA